MTKRKRRKFNSEEKVKILRMHLLEGNPISDLCEQHHIQPSQFYQWQRQFFENGARAFESKQEGRQQGRLAKQVETLEGRLQRKHEVLSELMEEHLQLKKDLGEL